jgi:hypothetical protein
LRESTPAGDVWGGFPNSVQRAQQASPAVPLISSQLEKQSDFKPQERFRYDQFWHRWRKKSLDDYNSLGKMLSPSAKQAALAAEWARGVTGQSFLLSSKADPNNIYRHIPDTIKNAIYQDWGGPAKTLGFEMFGSSTDSDTYSGAWWDIAWHLSAIKSAFWSAVNVLRSSVADAIDDVGYYVQLAKDWTRQIWLAIKDMAIVQLNNITGYLRQIRTAIESNLAGHVDSLREHITAYLDELRVAVAGAIQRLQNNWVSQINWASNYFRQGLESIRYSLAAQMEKFQQGVFNAAFDIWNHITKTMDNLPSLTWNALKLSGDGIRSELAAALTTDFMAPFADARIAITKFITEKYDEMGQYLRDQAPITPEKVPARPPISPAASLSWPTP